MTPELFQSVCLNEFLYTLTFKLKNVGNTFTCVHVLKQSVLCFVRFHIIERSTKQ